MNVHLISHFTRYKYNIKQIRKEALKFEKKNIVVLRLNFFNLFFTKVTLIIYKKNKNKKTLNYVGHTDTWLAFWVGIWMFLLIFTLVSIQ